MPLPDTNPPADVATESTGASIPPNALDQALENLLEETPAIYVEPPADDLASNLPLPPLSAPVKVLDPLNPSAEVWEGLEQAVKQAKEDELHQAHHHRLTPPEELPDISNL